MEVCRVSWMVIDVLTGRSDCVVLAGYSRLPDKLRSESDLYHGPGISISRFYPCSLRASVRRPCRTSTSAAGLHTCHILTIQHRQTLQNLIHHIRQLILNLNPGHIQLDHSPSSPILSLRTPYPRQLAEACQKAGFVVRAIMAPTVPKGQERVRVCVHAGNTEEEIGGLVGVIKRWMGGKL